MDHDQITNISREFFEITPKEQQMEAMASYMAGKDTILVAPTSFGKSLVYQIAPLLYDQKRYRLFSNSTTREQLCSIASTISSTQISMCSLKESDCEEDVFHTTSTPVKPVPQIDRVKSQSSDDEVLALPLDFSGLSIASSQQPKPAAAKRFSQFLVVMPLVALIMDSITKLKSLLPQISTVHLCAATIREAMTAVFIFTSPEVLLDGTGRTFLQKSPNIKAVFIDEFHVIEKWGTETDGTSAFRKAYGQLGVLRAFTKHAPIVCLSATATSSTIELVKESIKLTDPKIIKVSINRRNITYHRVRVTGSVIKDFGWLSQLIKDKQSQNLPRLLIFFARIQELIDAYQYVTVTTGQRVGSNFPAIVMYHLITDADIKERVLKDLGNVEGVVKCVFCSSSLSMGINLAAIEYVIHYGPPRTAEAFLQESGRVARDQASQGHSILLTYPRMATGRQLDVTMGLYTKAEQCIRAILLGRFNCEKPADQQDCCDSCEPSLTCMVKEYILNLYEDSLTYSFSDSLSVGSLGDIEELPTDP